VPAHLCLRLDVESSSTCLIGSSASSSFRSRAMRWLRSTAAGPYRRCPAVHRVAGDSRPMCS
jgi:hypothetical protein